MTTCVEVMRVNANDDQLQMIAIHVVDGQHVAEGDLLFILETTKSAVEVAAPVSGYIRLKAVQVGGFVSVGDPLCEISETAVVMEAAAAVLSEDAAANVSVTAKARRIAAERGIELDQVTPVGGRIGEAEVLAVLTRRHGSAGLPMPTNRPRVRDGDGGRRAIVIGGGGHAACVIDALEGAGYEIVGCVDQLLPVGHAVYRGVAVIGRDEDLARYRLEDVDFAFIGVGGADCSATRRKLFDKAVSLGFVLPAIVHPRAIVAAGSTLGAGCQVFAGATVGPRCTIGPDVIVNQGSIVCHDTRIGAHAHITPGAVLAGGVTVGRMSVVGMGATVLFQVKIGENCLIHNGAHVYNAVADNTTLDAGGKRSPR